MKSNLTRGFILTGATIVLNVTSVLAASFSPSDLANGGGTMFDPIIEKVKEIGSSAFNLGEALGVAIFVISLIFCGLCWMAYRSAMKKDENKSAFANVFLGGGIVFAAVPIAEIFIAIFNTNNPAV